MFLTTTDLTVINYLKEQHKLLPSERWDIEFLTNIVYNRDVCEYLSLFPDESVDLIFTDEPYGVAPTKVNLKARTDITTDFKWDKISNDLLDVYDHLMTGRENKEAPRIPMHLQNPWVFEAERVLKPHGVLINFGMQEFSATFRDVCRHAGLIWRASGPWIKTNPAPHFRKNNFRSGHETFYFASKGTTKGHINFLEQQEMVNYIIDSKCPNCDSVHPVIFSNKYDQPGWFEDVDTWVEVSPLHGDRQSNHGTEKPPWLLCKFLTIFSNEGDLVLDPFAGSGSTAFEANRLGRNWATNDITDEWYAFVTNRMSNTKRSFI